MKLKLEELTAEAFAPFGQVIERPARPTDATGPGWKWWGENLLMSGGERSYAVGYLALDPALLCFDWAERHMHTHELVIPLGGDCMVYAGPADFRSEPDRMPPLESFRAFRVRVGQAVLFGKGVWHGAPLALEHATQAIVLLLHDTGNVDSHVVRFEDTPVQVER
jgi:ureidoglycolate lyase